MKAEMVSQYQVTVNLNVTSDPTQIALGYKDA
jgi:hypothetical protein